MSKSDENTGTLNVQFRRTTDHRYIPATGAWGGISPNGEIVIDFFVEHTMPPDKLLLDVDNGKVVREERAGGESVIRELQVGIVLRPDIAYAIGSFLQEKAQTAGFKPQDESKQ